MMEPWQTKEECLTCKGTGCGEMFFNQLIMDIDMDPCLDCNGGGLVIDWTIYYEYHD